MAANSAFRSYAQDHGGRVIVLFLLFLLGLYQFYSAGYSAFVMVCLIPLMVLGVIISFRYRMFLFWVLFIINYIIMMKDTPIRGVPLSLPNEMLELMLLAIALIVVEDFPFNRIGNVMFGALAVWCGFCTLEVLNDTCNLGVNVGAWYQGARSMAFQLMYAFLVYTLYLTAPKTIVRYFYVWGAFALFAVFWVWKQKYVGLTHREESWLYGPGSSTHIIQGGTLIRYFSIYTDAANYGVGIASTAVAFIIFSITTKLRKWRIYYLLVGIACTWGMFPSGTRTGIVCLGVGLAFFLILSKSVKIIVPFSILIGAAFFILAFTNIGNGNSQIRRMRSAFDKDDASTNVRKMNQATMRKYMVDAPWGLGIGLYNINVPPGNKYNLVQDTPSDSEYVAIWVRTGIIGITVFLITTAIMFIGACWIVFFTIKSPSLRGIGAGLCCAMVSQQLGGYGNMVLMQFPNCLVFYGGLAIVYVLPHIEQEWIAYENAELEKIAEKKRLKLEKKKASRV